MPAQSTVPKERADHAGLRSALWLPIFDDLAGPMLLARLAAEAEEAGWRRGFCDLRPDGSTARSTSRTVLE